MVRQLAAHAAAASVLLHALQPVEHDQVRPPVAQAALKALQTPARLAPRPRRGRAGCTRAGRRRPRAARRTTRPARSPRRAACSADDALDDGRLAGAASRHQRPHAVRRRWVGDPVGQLLHQRVTAVEVRGRLERVDDADLALLRCWCRLRPAIAARSRSTTRRRSSWPRSSGVVNVSQTNVVTQPRLERHQRRRRPPRPRPRAAGSLTTAGSLRRS